MNSKDINEKLRQQNIKKALGIRTGVEGGIAKGLEEKIIIHDKPAIQTEVKMYVQYRVAKIKSEHATQQGLSANRDWYVAQVMMETGWKDLSEPLKDKKGVVQLNEHGLPIPRVLYFESQKIAEEYLRYIDAMQKKNLKKLGIKNEGQRKDINKL